MSRAIISTLLAVIVCATARAGDHDHERHERHERHESHNYIIERQQTGSVSSGSTPTLRLINGSRETDVYRDGSMFERNNMVGVRR